MRKFRILKNTIIFGFDSAWTNNEKKPGAICAVEYDGTGKSKFHRPILVTFDKAFNFIKKIEKESSNRLSLIALDQSLIVNNLTGMRPVEKIAGSVVGWAGGGVQPSNRSRQGMFDDNAPIWEFLEIIDADKNPDGLKQTEAGRYIVEVFPALALLGLDERFYRRMGAPRYNPGNQNFNLEHWKSVCNLLAEKSSILELKELSDWANQAENIQDPKKKDQDMLDAAICALIGVIWIACEDICSVMIGNMETGYMITPVIEEMRIRLDKASKRHGIY